MQLLANIPVVQLKILICELNSATAADPITNLSVLDTFQLTYFI